MIGGSDASGVVGRTVSSFTRTLRHRPSKRFQPCLPDLLLQACNHVGRTANHRHERIRFLPRFTECEQRRPLERRLRPLPSRRSRAIKRSPPYAHGGRVRTLEDVVEFFNFVLDTHDSTQETIDLAADLRQSSRLTDGGARERVSNRF